MSRKNERVDILQKNQSLTPEEFLGQGYTKK